MDVSAEKASVMETWYSLAEVNFDLSQTEPVVMFLILLAIVILGHAIMEVSRQICKYFIAKNENQLKLRMVERGFTASEIISVLKAEKESDEDDIEKSKGS